MPELLIVGFQENIHRASGVLDELRVLDDRWILELADAVAVHRDDDGTVAMDQSYQPTGRRASEWGTRLGFLIAVTLAVPSIADALPLVAAGARVARSLADVGTSGVDRSHLKGLLEIPEAFFEKADRLIQPGDSAIYALLDDTDSPLAASRFQRYGGRVIDLNLSTQQVDLLDRLLKDDSGSHER